MSRAEIPRPYSIHHQPHDRQLTESCRTSLTMPQLPSESTTPVPGGCGATDDRNTSTTSGSKSQPLRLDDEL